MSSEWCSPAHNGQHTHSSPVTQLTGRAPPASVASAQPGSPYRGQCSTYYGGCAPLAHEAVYHAYLSRPWGPAETGLGVAKGALC
eukprot:5851110-Prymnesium_polylepis.1